MINTHKLELSLSRTSCYSSTGVRVIEIWLYLGKTWCLNKTGIENGLEIFHYKIADASGSRYTQCKIRYNKQYDKSAGMKV